MKILFLGDTCIQEKVEYSEEFEKILKEIDMTILNFEGYFDKISGNKLTVDKKFFFEMAKKLKLKAVSLANNHINDERQSLDKTIKILEENGIEYFGLKSKKHIEIENLEIFSCVWELTGGNQEKLESFKFDLDIKIKKDKVNILFPHWGVEMEKLPHPWQVSVAHKLLDNGFECLIGHHTHKKSLVEIYKGKKIIYSLGNFIMPANELTYYYPNECYMGLGVVFDTTNKEINIFKMQNVKNKIEILDIEYSATDEIILKDYKKFFSENRVKKILPIFDENIGYNKLKGIINKILINLFKINLIKKIWKFLKRKNKIEIILLATLSTEGILGGETIKNDILYKWLSQKYQNNIKLVNYQKKISDILKVLCTLFYPRNKRIILSKAAYFSYFYLKYFYYFNFFKKELIYFVIGGRLDQIIFDKKHNIKYYKNVKKIYVETNKQLYQLNRMGLENVVQVPNFKNFSPKSYEAKDEDSSLKCVFFSRITPNKGVDIIFEMINSLKNQDIKIDFYGPIDVEYKISFFEKLNSHPNLNYLGILDTNIKNNYEILSRYDLMLFPTFWEGEGFPGTLIDSLIANLPVLASDWNSNSEIIKNGITGFLFKSKNQEDFNEKILDILNNKNCLNIMKLNCYKESKKYQTNYVLNRLEL